MNVWGRRASRVLLAAVLLGVLAVLPAVRHPVLRSIGWALVVDEPVEPADVIVLPQWAGRGGAIDAADLVDKAIASRVVVLQEPSKPAEQELTRRRVPYRDEAADLIELLRSLGVAQVERLPIAADGTEAEGQALASWCQEHRFRSIVVVSPPDHSRRVRRVLRRWLLGHPTRVVVRAARYSSFDPDRWWQRRDNIRIAIVEIQKLVLDAALHPFS